jgi:DNA polymerase-3 subunit epsilon
MRLLTLWRSMTEHGSATDRIVELAILRAEPGKKSTLFHKRLNPQRPIPQEATAIHGITDKDVANSPCGGF